MSENMKMYYAMFIPEEKESFSVLFVDFPGCATWGENREHAFAMALDALEGYMEALADDGDVIPAPSSFSEAHAAMEAYFVRHGETMPEGTTLQLVPVPDVQEKPTRVNVSFRRATISLIDRKAEALGMTRSGFLSRAAEAYQG